MDKLLFKRIILGLLTICIISYIVYLFANSNFAKAVDTEEAVYNNVSDIIHSEALIVRDESFVSNDESGVLSYNVNDGDNVNGGQTIADIYNNESDAVSRQQIKKINKQIKQLRTLSNSYYKDSVGLDTINTQINNNIFSINANVNTGKLDDAGEICNNLLLTICERQLTTGSVRNFKAKINELTKKRNKIEANCSNKLGTVSANKAGYFISDVDGYEKSVKYGKIDKLSVKKLRSIKKKKTPSNVIGKIVTNPVWYIACEVSPDDTVTLAKLLNSESTIYVSMPSVTTEQIPASIYSINQRSKKDRAVLVLACDYMNSFLADARKENVEITTISYSGLKVSKRAIHEDYVTREVKDKDGKMTKEKKKVQGVYVLHGSELIFKEISIAYSASEYVLCNPEPPEDVLFSGETIELYDQVVIKGDNLYDGKVIA
ncbi:MAG: HlyD family efflux transporter periplasmic adaptor subunit [Ruminococcus sp.]|nr:HlyD family efflux transporter periplasmic adaptor subunit [Ruminococcus sp.]